MWSDNMDKKIRDAAESDIHGYEDKNWQKMESLLDKHLPQKKDRRRGFIFLLLIGLLLTTAIYFMNRNYSSADKRIVQEKDLTVSNLPVSQKKQNTTSIPALSGKNKSGQPATTEKTIISQPSSLPPQTITSNTIDKRSVYPNNNEVLTSNIKKSKKISTRKGNPVPAATHIQQETQTNIDQKENKPGKEDITALQPGDKSSQSQQDKEDSKQPLTDHATAEKTPLLNNKEEQIDSAIARSEQSKKKPTPINSPSRFSFNFSAGPDISSVGLDPGHVKMQYGFGIGYSFAKRFTIRTGFYAGRKIYSADSTNYKTPYSSGPYSYKLYNVDANCLVYEIPLTVSYSFAPVKNHNWFLSAGLSSYLMKKEIYKYTYKNQWGEELSNVHSYKMDNSHIFSVINLSGGYQYNFSKRFSLLAEPYIKVPVSGIGFGKVKLNSAGVLFTASLRPFGRL